MCARHSLMSLPLRSPMYLRVPLSPAHKNENEQRTGISADCGIPSSILSSAWRCETSRATTIDWALRWTSSLLCRMSMPACCSLPAHLVESLPARSLHLDRGLGCGGRTTLCPRIAYTTCVTRFERREPTPVHLVSQPGTQGTGSDRQWLSANGIGGKWRCVLNGYGGFLSSGRQRGW